MYRRNAPGQSLGFKLVNAANGGPLTGSAVTVYRSIDGGPQATAQGAVNEKGNGQYVFSPTAADLDGNHVSFLFVATGAVIEEKTVVTTMANPGDSQRFGLSALPASGTLALKPAVTLAQADVSGYLPANLLQVAGQSANAAGPVTFPGSIGTSTYAGADTPGTTTLLNRVPSGVALAATPPSWYTNPPTSSTIASQVDATLSAAHGAGAWGGGGGFTPSQIASAVWEEPKAAHATAGSFGSLLDAQVSSRSTFNASQAGVFLTPTGLDALAVEQGVNARQALSIILAANAGVLSGAGSDMIVIQAANGVSPRITATTDASGNRQVVNLNLP